MKQYTVRVEVNGWQTIVVEAEDEEEAMDLASDEADEELSRIHGIYDIDDAEIRNVEDVDE